MERGAVSERPRGAFDDAWGALLVGILAIAAVRATAFAFVQDDAFISYRYAHNLLEHGALVYNPGEYVEGYSNFLWVLLIALGMSVGANPVVAAKVLGGAASLGCVAIAGIYGRRVLLERTEPRAAHVLPFLALLLVALNPSSAAYATGGLATSFFAFGICTCLYLCLARPGADALPRWPGAVALGLLVLVRPEAPLVVGWIGLGLLGLHSHRLGALLWWSLPTWLIAGGYGVWKLAYYGSLLPNTFYAKSGHRPYFSRGLVYVGSFVWNYPYVLAMLAPAVALIGLAVRRRRVTREAVLVGCPAAIVVCFAAYVAWVGGGFMEYKPLMHVYPVAVLAFCAGLVVLQTGRGRVRWTVPPLVVGVLLGALACQEPRYPRYVFSPQILADQIDGHLHQWRAIGWRLRGVLPPHTVIAVGAAGAVPFYSRLETVDVLGLTDPHVAHLPVRARGVPGHEKSADDAYLKSRGVHLAFARPMRPVPRSAIPEPVAGGRWVFVRLDAKRWVPARYLTEDPRLTRWMRARPQDFIRTRRLHRRAASTRPEPRGSPRRAGNR